MVTNVNLASILTFKNGMYANELVLFSVVLVFTLSVVWVNSRQSHHLQKKIDRLQHELSVANNSAIGMGQQLIQLEKKIHTSQQKTTGSPSLRVIENPLAAGKADAHEVSRQLLHQGYSVEETARRSGLSYSEVSLINAISK